MLQENEFFQVQVRRNGGGWYGIHEGTTRWQLETNPGITNNAPLQAFCTAGIPCDVEWSVVVGRRGAGGLEFVEATRSEVRPVKI